MKTRVLVVLLAIITVTQSASAIDIWMDVDTALSEVPVNIMPLIDDTDFKTREESVAYDAAGMDLVWNFVTTDGAYTQTAVTPTTGGAYDWASQGNGMYSIEIPASGGGSINNDTEGHGWFVGYATGVVPWRGPIIGFRHANKNDLEIDDGTAGTNQDDMFDGTGYVGGTQKIGIDFDDSEGTQSDAQADDDMLGTLSSASDVATAVLAAIVEGTLSLQDAIQVMLAGFGGKAVVADNGTTYTITYSLISDANTDKMAITVDKDDGARSAAASIDP